MAHTKSHDFAVKAENLVKVFGDNRAVDGLDITVPTGTIYGVLGPNGAGKTTVINILATLMRPDGGKAEVFGHDVVEEAQVVRQLIWAYWTICFSRRGALSDRKPLHIFAFARFE